MIRYKLHEVTKHDGRPSTFPAPNPNGPPHGDPFPCPYPDDDDDEWGVSAQGQSKKEKATDVGAQSAIDILPTMNELLSTPFQTRVSISRVHPFWFIFPQRTHRNDPSRRPPSDGNDPEGNGDAYGPQPVAELKSPVDLLTKCHNLSVLLAVAGFICALIGILSFVWKALPRSISIFSTAALGSCGILGLIAFY